MGFYDRHQSLGLRADCLIHGLMIELLAELLQQLVRLGLAVLDPGLRRILLLERNRHREVGDPDLIPAAQAARRADPLAVHRGPVRAARIFEDNDGSFHFQSCVVTGNLAVRQNDVAGIDAADCVLAHAEFAVFP